MTTSLLAGGVQTELIPIEELPDTFWQPEESDARYTAERFFSQRPRDYQLCIQLIATGAGLLKVARLLHVHHQTVAAVREREGAAIDIEKERVKRNLRLAIELGAERLPDVLSRLPDGQLPVAFAILQDKLRDLEGEPTRRVEVTVRDERLTHDSVRRAITSFPEAIDVSATVSAAREEPQKGSPVPPPPAQAVENESRTDS